MGVVRLYRWDVTKLAKELRALLKFGLVAFMEMTAPAPRMAAAMANSTISVPASSSENLLRKPIKRFMVRPLPHLVRPSMITLTVWADRQSQDSDCGSAGQ